MAGATREQALSLITSTKNHADMAVKLSSLKKAKEILLCLEPSLAAEIFPYLVELQTSPESLIRKFLVELIEEFGLKLMEKSNILMPVLLFLLKDEAPMVVRQSIVCSIHFFCSCLEEMTLQFRQSGKIERWLEEMWMLMNEVKDAIFGISVEPGFVGTKLLAIKFVEIYVILFTSDANSIDISTGERKRCGLNISWVSGHPILHPSFLTVEANKSLGLLLDLLQSPNSLCGSEIIAIINSLAAIARKRPLHFSNILSALLGFDPNFETAKGGHTASIQYSLRTALLGFLQCTHPAIIDSRDRLLKALRAMHAGDTADQVIHKVDKMTRNNGCVSWDQRFNKGDQLSSQPPVSENLTRGRSMLQDTEGLSNIDDLPAKRPCYDPVPNPTLPVQVESGSVQNDSTANGVSSKVSLLDSKLTPVEKTIAKIGALMAEGERSADSIGILVSQIHPDLMADVVIANMKNLPKNPLLGFVARLQLARRGNRGVKDVGVRVDPHRLQDATSSGI